MTTKIPSAHQIDTDVPDWLEQRGLGLVVARRHRQAICRSDADTRHVQSDAEYDDDLESDQVTQRTGHSGPTAGGGHLHSAALRP